MEEEDYVNKIFRLTFKRDSHFSIFTKETNIVELASRALKLREPILIHPANEADVLKQIGEFVDVLDLKMDEAFNRRLDELDKLNPKDTMVEEIERMTGYSKQVTRYMIQIADGLLNATVEVADQGDSSEEEDINEAKDLTYINKILTFIIETPLDKRRKKVPVSEDTRASLRREILKAMINPEHSYHERLNSGETLDRLEIFSASKGGTKRRRKLKRTKRKLK